MTNVQNNENELSTDKTSGRQLTEVQIKLSEFDRIISRVEKERDENERSLSRTGRYCTAISIAIRSIYAPYDLENILINAKRFDIQFLEGLYLGRDNPANITRTFSLRKELESSVKELKTLEQKKAQLDLQLEQAHFSKNQLKEKCVQVDQNQEEPGIERTKSDNTLAIKREKILQDIRQIKEEMTLLNEERNKETYIYFKKMSELINYKSKKVTELSMLLHRLDETVMSSKELMEMLNELARINDQLNISWLAMKDREELFLLQKRDLEQRYTERNLALSVNDNNFSSRFSNHASTGNKCIEDNSKNLNSTNPLDHTINSSTDIPNSSLSCQDTDGNHLDYENIFPEDNKSLDDEHQKEIRAVEQTILCLCQMLYKSINCQANVLHTHTFEVFDLSKINNLIQEVEHYMSQQSTKKSNVLLNKTLQTVKYSLDAHADMLTKQKTIGLKKDKEMDKSVGNNISETLSMPLFYSSVKERNCNK